MKLAQERNQKWLIEVPRLRNKNGVFRLRNKNVWIKKIFFTVWTLFFSESKKYLNVRWHLSWCCHWTRPLIPRKLLHKIFVQFCTTDRTVQICILNVPWIWNPTLPADFVQTLYHAPTIRLEIPISAYILLKLFFVDVLFWWITTIPK
jgi:hypothetical protein